MRGRIRGFTLVELLVVIAIVGILVSLTLPAVQQSREAARRTQCLSQIRQLGIALHNYHDQHRILPAGAYVQGSSFPRRSGWGWGAMILPYVEQSPLYAQLNFDLPTTVGSNRPFMKQLLPAWHCPSDPVEGTVPIEMNPHPVVEAATGNYCGSEGMLSAMSAVKFSDITDGLSTTLMLGERASNPSATGSVPFTSGWYGILAQVDMHVNNSMPYTAAVAGNPINQAMGSIGNFSSHHPGGAYFVFGDGSGRLLNETIDGELYQALGTISGGEIVEF